MWWRTVQIWQQWVWRFMDTSGASPDKPKLGRGIPSQTPIRQILILEAEVKA